MSTDIETVINVEETPEDTSITESDNLEQIIFDLTVPLEKRIGSIDILYQNNGSAHIIDTIGRIGCLYIFSEAKSIENYLHSIVFNSHIDYQSKMICSNHLVNYSERGYECYNYLAQIRDQSFPLLSRLECMFNLVSSSEYEKRGVV
jgi:hypothetical protein